MIEIIFILLGLSLGSFANNVITFYVSGKFDLVKSRCPECKTILRWYELIPLLSYFLLNGKCSYCNTVIPLRYFLVELFSAIIALFSILNWTSPGHAILYFLLFYLLVIMSVIDYYTLRLPNILTGSLLAVSLILIVIEKSFLLSSIFISATLVIIFISINEIYGRRKNKKAIGEGDIKLIAVLSLLTGFPLALISLWSASLLALSLLIIFRGFKSLKRNTRFAFGPFLAAGYALVIIYSDSITNLLSQLFPGR